MYSISIRCIGDFFFISIDREIERCKVMEDILFFSGNVQAAEKYEHSFLALSELLAEHGESNDVSAVPFRSGVARLEHPKNTVLPDEEIIPVAGNGKEATKDGHTNRSEDKRHGSVQHAFNLRSKSNVNGVVIHNNRTIMQTNKICFFQLLSIILINCY